MHETLMFAWHMAQSDRLVSCLTVGMSREVSAAIGGLSTTDIRRIASTFTHDVGPRWGNRPDLWTEPDPGSAKEMMRARSERLVCRPSYGWLVIS